jgi:hypothetical protein
MLGRHVYRVRPLETGGWQVAKDGEDSGRGTRRSQREARALAEQLAAADEPSRIVVEDKDGAIAEERLFGEDGVATLGADDTPLGGAGR